MHEFKKDSDKYIGVFGYIFEFVSTQVDHF